MSSPRQIGAYQVLGELGRGSMGVVYRVRKGQVQRDLALKVISSSRLSNPTSRERFRREGRLLAKIRHPGVIRVHDAGEEGGILWYVMDIVEGESLEERVSKKGPLPAGEACLLVQKIAEAVAAIHDEGIVHRDLKPGNVLLQAPRGEPLIADFGLALELESDEQRLTRTGFSVGTPSYMSPEQVAAKKDVDARADVWALGGILYFALTGQEPFLCPTLEELVRQILEVEPRKPTAFVAGVGASVDELCLRALSKDRAKRPADARAFAAALGAAATVRSAKKKALVRPRAFVAGVVLGVPLLVASPVLDARTDADLAREALLREGARAEAARLAEANRQRVATLMLSVRAQIAEGDVEEALTGAREALRLAPEDPVVLAVYAMSLIPPFVERKPDGAYRRSESRRVAERALALSPRNPTVLLARAKLLSHEHGEKRAEVPVLLREVLSRGDRRDKLAAVSQWLLAVGPRELEPLLDAVDSCLKDAPSWAHAHFVRGGVLDYLERHEEARAAYTRCLDLAPKTPLARRARARDAERLADNKAALDDYRELVNEYPKSADLHFSLGTVAESLGDLETARRAYDAAIELWPANTLNPVLGKRGLLLYKGGEISRAMKDLEASTKGFAIPRDLKVLALCYDKLSLAQKARETWDRLLAIDFTDTDAILGAGAHRERESFEGALKFYRTACERLRGDGLARVQGHLARFKRDGLLARTDESKRRLDALAIELEMLGHLPDCSVKQTRIDLAKRELAAVKAFSAETQRLQSLP